MKFENGQVYEWRAPPEINRRSYTVLMLKWGKPTSNVRIMASNPPIDDVIGYEWNCQTKWLAHIDPFTRRIRDYVNAEIGNV